MHLRVTMDRMWPLIRRAEVGTYLKDSKMKTEQRGRIHKERYRGRNKYVGE